MDSLRVGFVMVLWVAAAVAGAQVPASAPTSQSTASGDTVSGRTQDLLQPTINSLPATLSTLRLEKWKAPNKLKDATMNNITSIKRDLQDTLPPLLKAADAAPRSVSTLLAVMQNVDALYDVVLRVGDAAEIAAPQAQSADVAQGVSGLLVARRALEEMMRTAVSGQEQKVTELQKSLNDKNAAALASPLCPAAPATPTKKKTMKKPTAQ